MTSCSYLSSSEWIFFGGVLCDLKYFSSSPVGKGTRFDAREGSCEVFVILITGTVAVSPSLLSESFSIGCVTDGLDARSKFV